MNTIEQIEKFFVQRNSLGIKPGLERIRLLLQKLNNPETNVDIIHVAGTNGKGSTVQLIANSLSANGYRVGVFTSPSFSGLRGHFLIDGKAITEKDLISYMTQLIPIVRKLDKEKQAPTGFEILTALALFYFSNNADILILEAGMGGKEDTTNCILPFLSIITSVAIDHADFLGNTVTEIAQHKAGIIKERRPVICGPVSKEVEAVIKEKAQNKKAPLYLYDRDFTYHFEKDSFIEGKTKEIPMNANFQLKGKHQKENSALAMMALQILQARGYQLKQELIKQAMAETRLPGRFETILSKPRIIIDSAHNLAGMKAFVATAKESQLAKRVLFACFKDKEKDKMIALLKEAAFNITLTTFDHERAAKKEEFKPNLEKDEPIHYVDNWQDYLDDRIAEGKDLFIVGSLHFVTLVRQYVKENQAQFLSISN